MIYCYKSIKFILKHKHAPLNLLTAQPLPNFLISPDVSKNAYLALI